MDLRPAFVGAGVERLDVGVVGHQQLVLFAQPLGVPVGGLGVDVAPLRVLLADRLARRGPVAPLLALSSDVVGGAAGLLIGLLGGGQFDGQRVDLGGDVALVQVFGLLDRAPVILDGQPVGVLVQAGVGDGAAEAGEHVGGVYAHVVACGGDDVDGLGGTNLILGPRYLDSTSTGVNVAFMCQDGANLNQLFSLPTNVVAPIIAALNPQLVIWHMKELADIGESALSNRLNDLEVGLDPNGQDVIAYTEVADIKATLKTLLEAGATMHQDIKDVGRGLLIAQVKDANRNVLGLRQSPK